MKSILRTRVKFYLCNGHEAAYHYSHEQSDRLVNTFNVSFSLSSEVYVSNIKILQHLLEIYAAETLL